MIKLDGHNPYEILAVNRDASKAEIRAAYARSKQDPQTRRAAHSMLIDVNARLAVDALYPEADVATDDIEEEHNLNWLEFVDLRSIVRRDTERLSVEIFRDILGTRAPITTHEATRAERHVSTSGSLLFDHLTLAPQISSVDFRYAHRDVQNGESRVRFVRWLAAALFVLVLGGTVISSLETIAPGRSTRVIVRNTATLRPAVTDTAIPNYQATFIQGRAAREGINREAETDLPPGAHQAGSAQAESAAETISTRTPRPTLTAAAQLLASRTPMPSPAATATVVEAFEPHIVISEQTAAGRSCPWLRCGIVAGFTTGTKVPVYEVVEGEVVFGSADWNRIVIDGQDVFVHSALTRPSTGN